MLDRAPKARLDLDLEVVSRNLLHIATELTAQTGSRQCFQSDGAAPRLVQQKSSHQQRCSGHRQCAHHLAAFPGCFASLDLAWEPC